MLEPPRAEFRERAGQIFRPRWKAVTGAQHEAAPPASLDLQLVSERLRLGFGLRLGWVRDVAERALQEISEAARHKALSDRASWLPRPNRRCRAGSGAPDGRIRTG